MQIFALALVFLINNFIWMVYSQSLKEGSSFTDKMIDVVPKVKIGKKERVEEMDVRSMPHGESQKALDTLLGLKK